MPTRVPATTQYSCACYLDRRRRPAAHRLSAARPLACRLAWLRRTAPHVWRSTVRWITFGEYLELEFFGHCRAGYSAASWSGLLDRQQLCWDQPLLYHLGLAESQLSPLVDSNEPFNYPIAGYANRWPALASVPWFPVIGHRRCRQSGQRLHPSRPPGTDFGHHRRPAHDGPRRRARAAGPLVLSGRPPASSARRRHQRGRQRLRLGGRGVRRLSWAPLKWRRRSQPCRRTAMG